MATYPNVNAANQYARDVVNGKILACRLTAELNSLMLRDGVPDGKVYLSRISEAISLATGEVAHQLRAPVADIVLGSTELPVVGTITWATYTEASS